MSIKYDKRDAGDVTRGVNTDNKLNAHTYQHTPVIHKGSPLNMKKVRRHR